MRTTLLIVAALSATIAAHLLSTQRTFSFVIGSTRIVQFSSTLAAGAIKFQIFPGDIAVFPTGFLSRRFAQTYEILPLEAGVNYDLGTPAYYFQLPIYFIEAAFIIALIASWTLQSRSAIGESSRNGD